jgi:hypothetical protein
MNLDKVTTLISVIAAVFAAFLYLQSAHFGADEGAALEKDVQRQITELDVDRNSKIRVYYERKLDAGEELSTADQRRYDQVQRDLERGQDKLELLQ